MVRPTLRPGRRQTPAVVQLPRVDYLSVAGFVDPQECGFVEREKDGVAAWWRPGWWGRAAKTKAGRLHFRATAERGLRVWPQAWGYGTVHLTRVDVCCDVEGFTFTEEHAALFTSRGNNEKRVKKHQLRTLYLGSRESPVFLRIYLKSKHNAESEHAVWSANGWSGGDVWRIEYEFKRRGIPGALVLPRDATELFADGLSRIRMCEVPPSLYSQNQKARTHPLWRQLGTPRRITRRRAGEMAQENDAAIDRALDRLAVRAGAAMLPRLVARLQRALTQSATLLPHPQGAGASHEEEKV